MLELAWHLPLNGIPINTKRPNNQRKDKINYTTHSIQSILSYDRSR